MTALKDAAARGEDIEIFKSTAQGVWVARVCTGEDSDGLIHIYLEDPDLKALLLKLHAALV